MTIGLGFLTGFNRAAAQEREHVRDRELQRDKQELSILEALAKSPDPEIASAAVAGLLNFADPRKKRKGIAGFLGETEGHAALPQIRSLVQAGVFQPTTDYSLRPQDGLPAQDPPPATSPGAGQLTTPPSSAAQPTTSPVTGGPMAMPTPVSGIRTMPTSGPPPNPVRATPGPSVRPPRRVLSSGPYEDRLRGLVEGARVYGAEFTPEETKQLALEIAGFNSGGLGRGAGNQSVAGEMPDGKGGFVPAFGVFDRAQGVYLDPNTSQPLIGFRPRTTTGSRSFGTDREALARTMFGKPFAQLTPEEAGQVDQAAIARTREVSFQRGTGTGQARINTELGMPLDPNMAAQQGVPVGSSLGTLQGIVPITAEQSGRLEAVKALAPNVDAMKALVQRVFPPSSGLVGGLTAEAVIRQKRITRDPELAQLEALVNLSVGNVARVVAAESGRLTEQDAQRARSALLELNGGLLSGDTQESALAKLRVLEVAIERVGGDLRRPGDVLRERQQSQQAPAPAGGPPAPPPASAVATPTAPSAPPAAPQNASPAGGPPAPAGQPPASQTVSQAAPAPAGGPPPRSGVGVPQATGPQGMFFSPPPAAPVDPALANVHVPGSEVIGPDGRIYVVVEVLPDGKLRTRPKG